MHTLIRILIHILIGNFHGGVGCSGQINGACLEQQKDKGAYPDFYLHLPKWVLYVEVDENRHAYYNKACEAARLDIVHFGSQVLKPSLLIRFNPHLMKGESEVSFEDRVKNLAQRLRNALRDFDKQLDLAEEVPVMHVQYMFYGDHSIQMKEAKTYGSNAIKFLDDIDSPDDLLSLDNDISSFSIKEDVCAAEVDKNATADTIEMMQRTSRHVRCSYLHKNQTRCSAVALNTSEFCWAHNAIIHRVKE